MRLDRLTTKIVVNSTVYYTPDDPFLIYTRLAKLITPRPVITKYTTNLTRSIQPKKISDLMKNTDYCMPHTVAFLVCLYQNIPTEFWKFNIAIDGVVKEIRDIFNNFNSRQLWVDKPNLKNKIKLVGYTHNVIDELKRGELIIPSYDEIVKQVYNWGHKTKYAFGSVKNIYPKGGGL